MDSHFADQQLSSVAAAIAEPARARMLCALMDQRARTSTELAILAEVSPSTASAHLTKLREQNLVTVVAQGKHRYYQLASLEVAVALEALMNIASLTAPAFKPSTPDRLRRARTCYDHMAGEIAVQIHTGLIAAGWLMPHTNRNEEFILSDQGKQKFEELGIELQTPIHSRRRYACNCLDWSERRPHLGGSLGAAFLRFVKEQAWVEADLDSRALAITRKGERQFAGLLQKLNSKT